jgi:hypothetical protein
MMTYRNETNTTKTLHRWRTTFAGVAAAGLVALVCSAAWGAATASRPPRTQDKGPIHRFLVNHGVAIDAPIRVAKVSAVIGSRFRVRSIVKFIGPDKLPNPQEIEQLRKMVEAKKRQGVPIRFDLGKHTSELDLMRHHILTGEVIEFYPSEKVGELELFFSESHSLKVEFGEDFFYIRVGNKDCSFRSEGLKRQLNEILQPSGVQKTWKK